MRKFHSYLPPFLQNHPKTVEFPIKESPKDIETSVGLLSTILVLSFCLLLLSSAIMFILWIIISFSQWLSISIDHFYTFAHPVWWSTLGIFILMVLRLSTQTNPAKKEQKLYYKLTQQNWLPREKREGLRLELFSIYRVQLWSETLEYYPLLWKIENPEKFQTLSLASDEHYRDFIKKWWSISSASSLKFMIEKLLQGMHAPLFATSLHENPQLLEILSTNTGFSIEKIQKITLKTTGSLPPLIWAFDLARVVSLARDGYMAKLLSEDEAWDFILKAKNKAYEIFQSDRDFFDNYVIGFVYWQNDFEACQQTMQEYQEFLENCHWPMRRLRWNNRFHIKKSVSENLNETLKK